jgi:hypothetical protein
MRAQVVLDGTFPEDEGSGLPRNSEEAFSAVAFPNLNPFSGNPFS